MTNVFGSFLLNSVLFTQKFGKTLNKLQRKIAQVILLDSVD